MANSNFTELMFEEPRGTGAMPGRTSQNLSAGLLVPRSPKASPDFMSIEPTQVGGEDVSVNDASAAYAKLEEMANSQREKAPWMSSA